MGLKLSKLIEATFSQQNGQQQYQSSWPKEQAAAQLAPLLQSAPASVLVQMSLELQALFDQPPPELEPETPEEATGRDGIFAEKLASLWQQVDKYAKDGRPFAYAITRYPLLNFHVYQPREQPEQNLAAALPDHLQHELQQLAKLYQEPFGEKRAAVSMCHHTGRPGELLSAFAASLASADSNDYIPPDHYIIARVFLAYAIPLSWTVYLYTLYRFDEQSFYMRFDREVRQFRERQELYKPFALSMWRGASFCVVKGESVEKLRSNPENDAERLLRQVLADSERIFCLQEKQGVFDQTMDFSCHPVPGGYQPLLLYCLVGVDGSYDGYTIFDRRCC